MDGAGVRLGEGEGRVQGEPGGGGGRGLTAAVKAGNAGFRIAMEFAFLKFWVPSFFVLNKIERGATLFL